METSADKKIYEVVDSEVRKHFKGTKIISVDVREDIAHDGDEILRVRVVFSAGEEGLDTDLVLSMVRHLRPELDKINVSAFPMVDYVSEEDSMIAAT